jgi:hypothetical protein
MAKLVVHLKNGTNLEAPFEAWLVAMINVLPDNLQQELFRQVASLHGASIIPDKYIIGEDALGTIEIIERPRVDLKIMRH